MHLLQKTPSWLKFLTFIAIISFFICINTLGLILDFTGALLLLAPEFPMYRKKLYEILPIQSLKDVNRMEDRISSLNSGITIQEGDVGYGSLSAIIKQETNNEFDEIQLEVDSSRTARHVHVTVNPARGYSIGRIESQEQDLRNLLERAVDRRTTAIGAFVLATGFLLQILAQILPPIISPARLVC